MKNKLTYCLWVNFLILSAINAKHLPPRDYNAECNDSQARLFRKMNEVVSSLVVSRANWMARITNASENAAIATCVYTSGSDRDEIY